MDLVLLVYLYVAIVLVSLHFVFHLLYRVGMHTIFWVFDHTAFSYIIIQEADKIALAETTGLDQKQINNWFINQRKRHWKPSENMQFAVMDNHSGQFFTDDWGACIFLNVPTHNPMLVLGSCVYPEIWCRWSWNICFLKRKKKSLFCLMYILELDLYW